MNLRAIAINKEIYNKPLDIPAGQTQGSKMNIALFLPPTDIPQFIYPTYRKDEDVLSINFKYTNEEKEKELFSRENVKLIIGCYSGKPLRIELQNLKSENITTVQLTHIIREDINKLIQESIAKTQDMRQIANLKCTGEVLKENAEALSAASAM